MILRVLCLLLLAPPALARKTPCDSCESCTQAAAQPGAILDVRGDLTTTAATCVSITADGVQFVGNEHHIRAAQIAVQISGKDANVRRLTATAPIGLKVTGPRATLLGITTKASQTGLVVDGATDVRVVRSTFEGGQIGIGFGTPKADRCPASQMRSPGAVLSRVTVRGTKIGIAACEATPVIVESTITKNQLGLLIGAPAAVGTSPGAKGAYDACLCAPELTGTKASTTLFFSSGCGGCKVHEGWLPEVQQMGYDIAMRPTGKENRAATERYDAFIRRCAPEITDAIGIPGCVPNYACLASHSVFKRRDGTRITRDFKIGDPAGMANFAARCAAAAQEHTTDGKNCVRYAIRSTKICGNTIDGQLGRALTGVDNTCTSVKGQTKALGCTPCP